MTTRATEALLVLIPALILGTAGCTTSSGSRHSEPAPVSGVYRGLSAQDIALAKETRQRSLETLVSYQSMTWSNDRSGSGGRVTPLRTYKTADGIYCREFMEIVEIRNSGRHRDLRIACRDRDARWKLVSEGRES